MNLLMLYVYAYSDSEFSNESALIRYVDQWIRVEFDDASYYRFRLTKVGSEFHGCVRYCSNLFEHTLPSSSSLVVMFQNVYDYITR